MKKFFYLSMLIFSFNGFALTGHEVWEISNFEAKKDIIEAYRQFIIQYEQTIEVSSNTNQLKFFKYFIESVSADSSDNCLFAGWPSILSGGKCKSPSEQTGYTLGQCGAGKMQCQPLLFSKNLCVPSRTPEEKSSAFSNCLKEFKIKNKSLKNVVEEVMLNKDEKKLFAFMAIADQVCLSGLQSKTGMCNLLRSRLSEIKTNLLKLEPLLNESLKAVNNAEKTLEQTNVAKKDCLKDIIEDKKNSPKIETPETDKANQETKGIDPKEISDFERVNSRYGITCQGIIPKDGYGQIYIYKDSHCEGEKVTAGFSFTNGNNHPYLSNVKSKYPEDNAPTRKIEFISRDNASNDTFLYLEDTAGGPDSHDVKSVMVIIPRKIVPKVDVVGNDVVMTLTTGEKVVLDKESNAIKSGALKEGPIDLTTDRFKRTPPNVSYSGFGISIRVNHRYLYPTEGADFAEIKQGNRVCKLSKNKIWDKDGMLTTDNDQKLLKLINESCPTKNNEKQFSI